MDTYLTLIPREITGTIFSYLDSSTRDELLSLPEFQFILQDNYFWYLQTSYDFPKYFAIQAKEEWKKIYQGLTFLMNPKIEIGDDRDDNFIRVIQNAILTIPNLLETFLNYNDETKQRMVNFTNTQIYQPYNTYAPFKLFQFIMNKILRKFSKKYPETFKYLIKYGLLKSDNTRVTSVIKTWILEFDDPELLSFTSINNKSKIYDVAVRSRIFDVLTNREYPNITVNDYLDMLMDHDYNPEIIDHIIKLIGPIDSHIIFNFFHQMIVTNIHPFNLRYIWYKYRELFNQDEMEQLRELVRGRRYLNPDDIRDDWWYKGESVPHTFR